MEPVEGLDPDPDADAGVPGHAWRASAIIAASLLAILATGIVYLRPSLETKPSVSPTAPRMPAPASYVPAAVDFVGPDTGWVLALFDSGAYALLATDDGGRSWTKQLSGAAAGRSQYLRFFDARNGVLALVGQQSQIYTTRDGGRTWKSPASVTLPAGLLSVNFVDPTHGWLLLASGWNGAGSGLLMRTDDGGASWISLGPPVPAADEAFRVQFVTRQTGWLDSLSSGPYAYRSDDAGATWQRVWLPAPSTGWPKTGQFLVVAHPTRGLGVVTSVVNFQPTSGRSGIGGLVLAYPPLTVGTFDGGVPVRYVYATLIDNVTGGGAGQAWIAGSATQVEAPDQVNLGSLDGGQSWTPVSPPGDGGAIGYASASILWWIGSGQSSRSSDGGRTWTRPRTVGVIAPLPSTLQLVDQRTAWYGAMAGTRPALETTDDGGVHWRMVLMPTITP